MPTSTPNSQQGPRRNIQEIPSNQPARPAGAATISEVNPSCQVTPLCADLNLGLHESLVDGLAIANRTSSVGATGIANNSRTRAAGP